MIVAGLGFRRGVAADEIVAIVHLALDRAALARNQLGRLATAEGRATEPGLLDAARLLDLDVELVTADRLAAAEPHLKTRSARVFALHRVGSVAEAAALCAAGPEARLVVARISNRHATCAIATGKSS